MVEISSTGGFVVDITAPTSGIRTEPGFVRRWPIFRCFSGYYVARVLDRKAFNTSFWRQAAVAWKTIHWVRGPGGE